MAMYSANILLKWFQIWIIKQENCWGFRTNYKYLLTSWIKHLKKLSCSSEKLIATLKTIFEKWEEILQSHMEQLAVQTLLLTWKIYSTNCLYLKELYDKHFSSAQECSAAGKWSYSWGHQKLLDWRGQSNRQTNRGGPKEHWKGMLLIICASSYWTLWIKFKLF